ncbi:hypothetical protein QR680_009000 [Steinernema hermaphroditum]|uniref:C2 domain-containing protein n=1 Tax=Steinernema hermaphroditum TaxID=289476 RepID=A0AA39M8N1_9BILA|nr:hypothetical protein QR680_009000 [Steinernema hermaphroditum]
MREDFYRQAVNALLLSEAGGRTYQLVEHLKQVTDCPERTHNEILNDVEHSIRFSVELTIRSRRTETFVVVVEKSANAKVAREHRVASERPKMIDIGETSSVFLKVFAVEEEGEAASTTPQTPPAASKKAIRKTDSFLRRWVRFHSCKGEGFPIALKDFQLYKEHRVALPNDTICTFSITKKTKFTADGFPMEALVELTRHVMLFNYELLAESDIALDHKYAGELCDSSDALLRQMCHLYNIPVLSRRLVTLSVILEWKTDEKSIDDGAVDNLLRQIRSCSHSMAAESREFSEVLSKKAEDFSEKLLLKSKTGVFFPPDNSNFLYKFTCSIQQLLNICSLEIWQHHADLCPILDAKRDADSWMETQKAGFEGSLKEVCATVDGLQTLLRQFGHKYALFFNQFNITYAHVVLEALDSKLSDLICRGLKAATAELESRNREELATFTKKSMRLFDGVRMLLLYANNPPSLNLNSFEEWFEAACVFWTYAWRGMVKTCISRAVPLDGDEWHAPEGNVSESAVMFLGLCKAHCDDLVRLRPTRPRILLTCVLKTTSILSDSMVSYALRLRESLRDSSTICRVLRLANSVEHVQLQLTSNYHRFLRLDRLRNHLGDHEYTSALACMSHMFAAAQKTCVAVVDALVERACFLKRESVREHTEAITMYPADTSKRTIKSYMRQILANERAEGLLGYLERSISLVETSCLPSLFVRAHEALWKVVEGVILETLLFGQAPEYYVEVEKDCERICRLLDVPFRKNGVLGQRIHLNKMSTQDIALQYYSVLAELCTSWPNRRQASDEKPLVPKVMMRLGYLRASNQQIILHAHILNGFDVPILDRITQSSDPYVRLEFYPRCFFPLASFPAQTTQMKKQTLRPCWNETFQFLIPEELFFTNGACLCLSVLDHDVLSYNDLAGQALIPLASIKRVKSLSSKHLPYPTTMAFPLPTPRQYTEYFKILKERSAKNPLAQEIFNYEKYVRDYRLLPPEALDEKETNAGAKRLFSSKLKDFWKDVIN